MAKDGIALRVVGLDYAAGRSGSAGRLPFAANSTGQGLLLVGLALLCLGAVMVYSASVTVASSAPLLSRVEIRHLLYAAAAIGTLTTLWRVDYRVLVRGRRLPNVAAAMLGVSLVLSALVLVPGIGAELNGARRWLLLPIGPYTLSLQPSELVKFTLVVFLACWLGRKGDEIRSFRKTFLPAILLTLLSVGVVIKEDFGTACVIAVSAAAVMLLAAIPWYYLLSLTPLAALGFYLFVFCKENRWARIVAFVNPWDAGNRWTFQVRQSLIAIGSGGMWGTGLGNGRLKLGYVPLDNSDFIFAVICEELGFAGAAGLLGMVGMLIYLTWQAGRKAADTPGRLLAGGLGLLIAVQAIAHVAVNIGSVPPTGMIFPLVSTGGTALVLAAAAVAIMISVTAHRAEDGKTE